MARAAPNLEGPTGIWIGSGAPTIPIEGLRASVRIEGPEGVPALAVGSVAAPVVSADERLILRARAGEADAFDALIATRVDRCYRLAWTILGNDADAADATQDAFVAA